MTWTTYRIPRPANSLFWIRTYAEICDITAEDSGMAAVEILDGEMEHALETARMAGWDGFIDEEPHVFVLPNFEEFQFGFVWTSPDAERPMIVVSPQPLPWLEGWK